THARRRHLLQPLRQVVRQGQTRRGDRCSGLDLLAQLHQRILDRLRRFAVNVATPPLAETIWDVVRRRPPTIRTLVDRPLAISPPRALGLAHAAPSAFSSRITYSRTA